MKRSLSAVFLTLLALIAFGCQPAAKPEPSTPSAPAPAAASEKHSDDDGHAHGHSHDVGPQGGILAVLGQHQFHAEAIADEKTGAVKVFVYDGTNQAVKIDAKELTINLMVDDKPAKYTLLVDHDGSDGKPAVFAITDAHLAEHLCDGWKGDAKVSIDIAGAPCVGNFAQPKHKHEH